MSLEAMKAELRSHIKNNERDHTRIEADQLELWKAVNIVRQRPPVWAGLLISLLAATCGFLVG